MKKLVFIVLSVVFLFFGCGEDSKKENTAELKENAVAVESGAVEDWEVTENSVKMPLNDPLVGQVTVGKILVGGSATKQLLRKISSVETQGDFLVLQTADAALTDAFEELYMEFSTAKADDFANGLVVLYPEEDGLITMNVLRGEASAGMSWQQSLDVELVNDSGVSAELEGDFAFQAQISGLIDIDRLLRAKQIRLKFDGDYDVTLEQHLKVQSELQKTYEKSIIGNILIAQVGIPIPTFPPLYIWIDVNGEIKGGLEASVYSEIEASVGQRTEGSLEFGIEYKDSKWQKIYDSNFNYQRIGPELSAYGGMIIKPYIRPEISFEILSVAGPYIGLEGYGKLEGKVSSGSDPNMTLSAGLNGVAGGKVDVFGFETAINFTLFDIEKEIWSNQDSGDTGNTDDCSATSPLILSLKVNMDNIEVDSIKQSMGAETVGDDLLCGEAEIDLEIELDGKDCGCIDNVRFVSAEAEDAIFDNPDKGEKFINQGECKFSLNNYKVLFGEIKTQMYFIKSFGEGADSSRNIITTLLFKSVEAERDNAYCSVNFDNGSNHQTVWEK